MHAQASPGAAGEQPSIGFGVTDLGEGEIWGLSNGRFAGVCSNLTLYPRDELAVVVLANTGTMLADELGPAIVDALHPGFAERVEGFIASWEREHARGPYEPDAELLGTWVGSIVTSEGDVSFSMTFEADGAVWLTWDEAHEGRLDRLRRRDDALEGSFRAALPNALGYTGAQSIQLDLRLAGDRIYGSAVGSFATDGGSFALPAYVTLER